MSYIPIRPRSQPITSTDQHQSHPESSMDSSSFEGKVPLSARYPPHFKRAVMRYAETYSNREAERRFGIAESNIRRWRKLKGNVCSDHLFSDPESRAKRGSESCDEFPPDDEAGENQPTDNEKEHEFVTDINQLEMPQKSGSSEDSKSTDNDEVCLRWNSHHHNMKSMFPALLKKEQFVDVTLTSEGKIIKCHKLILSSCSTYFDSMLCDVPPNQHAIIFLNSVPFWLLKIIVDFMYTGEVHMDQSKLQDLLDVAEILQIKGLTGKSKDPEPPKDPPKKFSPNEKATPSPTLKPKSEQKPKGEEGTENKAPTSKKDTSKQQLKLKVIKLPNVPSMPLLKPIYVEDNNTDGNKTRDSPKKVGMKRMRKRKSSEHEPSPPPILYRKGTKSRPHVKVPKYYHNDYEDLESINVLSLLENEEIAEKKENNEQVACDLDKVKIEPLDVDDTLFTEVPEDGAETDRNHSNSNEKLEAVDK